MNAIKLRHSIRNFKEGSLAKEELEELIRLACLAPNGKNQQNWYFVVVSDQAVKEKMARLIREKNKSLQQVLPPEEARAFDRSANHHTFFTKAPHVVLVYTGPYPPTGFAALAASGLEEQAQDLLATSPGIQNTAAAISYLLLAAADKGYGGCWMTGPLYAARELQSLFPMVPKGYNLSGVVPLGIPDKMPTHPHPRKDLSEVSTFL